MKYLTKGGSRKSTKEEEVIIATAYNIKKNFLEMSGIMSAPARQTQEFAHFNLPGRVEGCINMPLSIPPFLSWL